MKILFVNVVYGAGSTGNIVKNLFNECSKTNEAYLIYGRGKKVHQKNIFKLTSELESKVHHLISKITGNMYGGMFFSTRRIINKIKDIKPDIVNLHCINGYFVNIYKLLRWLAKNNIKTVLTAHADFMMTGGCGYTVECNKYLKEECKKCQNFKTFNGKISLNRANKNYKIMYDNIALFSKNNFALTCVSPWLAKRYEESPIYKGFNIKTILNPIDPIFMEKGLKNPYENKTNVLYVTPNIYDYVKCGWLIDELAKQRNDVNFTVICTRDVDYSFSSKNIVYIKGGVEKKLLRDYYFFADATVLLSKRETFSMVVSESLSCGTPVYGFKSGGPETIADANNSVFIDERDINALSKCLFSVRKNKEEIRKESFKKYSLESISKEYIDLYKLLLSI